MFGLLFWLKTQTSLGGMRIHENSCQERRQQSSALNFRPWSYRLHHSDRDLGDWQPAIEYWLETCICLRYANCHTTMAYNMMDPRFVQASSKTQRAAPIIEVPHSHL